ncbi:MAG: TolC family outer membrane protein [Hyphomicrobium sp.]
MKPGIGRRPIACAASRRWLATVSVGALLAIWGGAGASVAHAESLRDALTAAYHYNPRLDAERARLRATDEDVARAESGYRPVVQGTAELGHQKTTTDPESETSGATAPWGYSISVRQQVFNGFRTSSDIGEAEASVRAGRENLRLVETQVLLDAVTAYMDVVKFTSIVQIRENNVAVLSRELEAAVTRRSVKEVTKTDVAQAQARRARAVSMADLAKSELKTARANYERIVGHAPVGLNAPPLKLKLLPRSIEQAWATAERNNPNVSSAQYREEAARFAVDKVRGELLPEVNIEANFGHRERPSTFYDEQEVASVTGRVNIPLYDGGEVRARVRQAKHTHVSRLQEIEQARSETQANVTAAWSALMGQRAKFKSDDVQVEANRVALQGVREEESVGQRTLLDVLNAEQEFLDAQIELVSTRREVVVSSYQLLAAMGQLSVEQLELGSEIYDPEVNYNAARQNWFGIDIIHADGRQETYRAEDAAGGIAEGSDDTIEEAIE